ncbi:MAG: hypothetical protein LUQ20_08955 [Candidatus Methanoperedens sp.]|nr:hypothetical protein [Candidatus Methanoperedens sp.]
MKLSHAIEMPGVYIAAFFLWLKKHLDLLVIGILGWSFFNPFTASIVFLFLIILFEGYVLLLSFSLKPRPDASKWSEDEITVLRKYPYYFYYPFSSKSDSSNLSGIALSTFIWVPWLLYNNLWLPGIIIGANCFISGSLSQKLNPRAFLHDAVENRGKMFLLSEMKAVDSVCEKILECQREAIKSKKGEEELSS